MDDQEVAQIMQNIDPDGPWPDIKYADLSRTGFEHANHLRRALSISVTYQYVHVPASSIPEPGQSAGIKL